MLMNAFSFNSTYIQVIDKLLQAPLDRLKRAARILCVPILRLIADEEAVAFQRRQVRVFELYLTTDDYPYHYLFECSIV